ncbi:MAG: arginine--tRNA ligase [Chloroflexi bacterium]|nr:arginine--tRNA ligase [Chloroflexota bacterium]MDA1002950.1 arginine--tRNA ligase [Chloroflexota bacterium]
MIRDEILALVLQALAAAQAAGDLPQFAAPEVTVEHPQRPEHGDFSANLPLRIQGLAKMKAMEVAEALRKHVPPHPAVSDVRVAPPGFLNLYLSPGWVAAQAAEVAALGERFAGSDLGRGQRVQIEYVSANPTGPIHVGNGRGAAIGSTLANVMTSAGFEVEQEYYVNDAGTQVAIFGRTLYARYQQLFGREISIPENGYPGSYVIDVATGLKEAYGEQFLKPEGEEPDPAFGRLGIEIMVDGIRADLALMGVVYDEWYSERSLQAEGGPYNLVLDLLRDHGHIVEREGAVWFASSELGESKDNVLIRSDGMPTYYATDIAYHYDKFITRKFDRVIDIWGADHQGHVSRVKAAVQAVGGDPEHLDVLLYQLVSLRRGTEAVPLSKRAGEIVTLREIVEEVGADATRFFFLLPSANQTMDFDLELAKKQSDENPVFYVQYAHARIAGVITKAREEGFSSEGADPALLTHEAEHTLIRKLLLLPEVLETVVRDLAPHHLPHYAQELASAFHVFYTQCRVIDREHEPLTRSRLLLLDAARVVLERTLGLMGVSAPDQM